MRDKFAAAVARIESAVRAFEPIAVLGLFSGGHDSFCATYAASMHPAFSGAVHINTGTGIEATREYVIETAQRRGWDLLEYKAEENTYVDGRPNPQLYDALVRRDGFPGPAGHQMMYNHLKERQLERLERDFGATGRKRHPRRVLYVTGCRSQESDRRMGNTEEVQLDGRRVWVAAIHDWSKLDTSHGLVFAEQPRNLVVDLIHRSGECNCGAYAHPGELAELKAWDVTRPMYERLTRLEREVVPIFGRGWGERPAPGGKRQIVNPGMLCWSCAST